MSLIFPPLSLNRVFTSLFSSNMLAFRFWGPLGPIGFPSSSFVLASEVFLAAAWTDFSENGNHMKVNRILKLVVVYTLIFRRRRWGCRFLLWWSLRFGSISWASLLLWLVRAGSTTFTFSGLWGNFIWNGFFSCSSSICLINSRSLCCVV